MPYLLTKLWRKGTRSNQILVARYITTTHMTAILKKHCTFQAFHLGHSGQHHHALLITTYLLKMCLVVLTFFFVWSTCLEYADRRLSTSITESPLTIADNPTVTMCYTTLSEGVNIQYNDNFTASYRYVNSTGSVISTWKVGETDVKKMALVDSTRRHCFMFDRLEMDITGDRRVYLDIKEISFSGEYFFDYYFTSEENAHGVVNERWFDGEVSQIWIYNGEEGFVRLDDVHQYEHPKTSCSPKPFYECVYEQMLDSNDCSGGQLCEAVSLPKSTLSPCESEEAYNCSLAVFWKAYNSDCMQEISCTTVEYKLQEPANYYMYHSRPNNQAGVASIGYGFYPKSSQGSKNNPQKTVHTDYLTWNEFTLMAYVGGILGLTMGISLLDVYFWLFDKVGKTICQKKVKDPPNQIELSLN